MDSHGWYFRRDVFAGNGGAGCAFLDYDNDGWMDIYLVNSGRCDFYTPTNHCATRSITTIAMARLRT